MIKIAICDDEQAMCERLRQRVSDMLGQWGAAFQIACFTGPAELLNSSLDFGLIFLDIQMPGLDGIELAKRIREMDTSCAFIFVTVLEERMLDAFEVEAMDYLCKPIDEIRLAKALRRVLNRIGKENQKSLFIQSRSWCRTVKLNTIYYCEVINRKIYLHTKNEMIDFYGKMEDVEKQLDGRFVKCHRSYLANLEYLREYTGEQIIFENGDSIPVSRLRRQKVMESMLQYMKRGE